MSGVIVREVLECAPTDLNATQLLVFVALAEDARTGDRTAKYSSTDTLVKLTRRSPSAVKHALGDLTARGLIKPLHAARRGRVQHYYIEQLHDYHREAHTS